MPTIYLLIKTVYNPYTHGSYDKYAIAYPTREIAEDVMHMLKLENLTYSYYEIREIDMDGNFKLIN